MAVDIGNTDTVVGVYDGQRLVTDFRAASVPNLTVDEAGLFVTSLCRRHLETGEKQVNRLAICSVVPGLTDIYRHMARKYFQAEPIIIDCGLHLPFRIDYPNPDEIGPDRLANVAAGLAEFGPRLVVVDLGTATTFDIISKDSTYLGGIIAPGPRTAGATLAKKAARLFEVEVEKPQYVIGKSTAQAIKSGLYFGTVGMIDHLVERIFKELGYECRVVATGGLAESYSVDSKYISEIRPFLTLDGIRIITDQNR